MSGGSTSEGGGVYYYYVDTGSGSAARVEGDGGDKE
jgi:hypothetical protein